MVFWGNWLSSTFQYPVNLDHITPFAVETLDVRGKTVRLGDTVNSILGRHNYPEPVSALLGEAVVLTVLLGASLKFEGRFQLQARSDGPVDLLVVDFDAPDRVRGYARFDAERLAIAQSINAPLLGRGLLGLTVDQGQDMSQYQGIVALDGQGLEAAAQQYFVQSEQIPTRVRLAVGSLTRPDITGSTHSCWRAGGIIVQFLPSANRRQTIRDLDPGDAPQGVVLTEVDEDDAWREAQVLVSTVADDELLDPEISDIDLLYRLFHERGVRVFEPQSIIEKCRCSQERITGMLNSFSIQERSSMVGDDGVIGVTCEFCSMHYKVNPLDVNLPP